MIRQVTEGNWEVTAYYGYDKKSEKIYYQSVENSSINRGVYVIGLNGKNKQLLSEKEGTNSASFSADFTYFINTFSSASSPPEYTLNDANNGTVLKRIKHNDKLAEKLSNYKLSEKEFSTIAINGNDLNMWTIKPVDFDPNKKYPFLCIYSGRASNNRWNSANDYWYQMLAQKGYFVVCIDGRGTGYKGADFKKAYMNLSNMRQKIKLQQQKKLQNYLTLMKSVLGYGAGVLAAQSTNCCLKEVIFLMAAVAPVTSWRFYDTIYTERYMRTPQENPDGYDDNSPLNYPEMLKGDYLLIHGSGDDNVHVQHTMRMVEALIQADKQFEWGIYPDKNHGIYGGNTRLHLYKKMTNFIAKTLGNKIEN